MLFRGGVLSFPLLSLCFFLSFHLIRRVRIDAIGMNRKTYTQADADKTLAKLGLSESASLSIADDLA